MSRVSRSIVLLVGCALVVGALGGGIAFGAGERFDAAGCVTAPLGAGPSEGTPACALPGPSSQFWPGPWEPIPVGVIETVQWMDDGANRLDGLVYNPAGALSNYADVVVEMTWLDASEQPVDSMIGWVQAWVLGADVTCPFTIRWTDAPVGATHYALAVLGRPVPTARVPLRTTYLDSGYGVAGPPGERWWVYSVTNDTQNEVWVGNITGWEHEAAPPAGPRTLLDVMDTMGEGTGLAPGQSTTVFLTGENTATVGYDVFATVQAEAYVELPPIQPPDDTSTPVPVYRFYDKWVGEHVYETNQDLANSMIADPGPRWQYDGIAFYVWMWRSDAERPGALPVYLLQGRRSGEWFYTASQGEADALHYGENTRWNFTGPLWWVPQTGDGAGPLVYRFYSPRTDRHFWTASEAERDYVLGNLGWFWQYEGAAFWTPMPPE